MPQPSRSHRSRQSPWRLLVAGAVGLPAGEVVPDVVAASSVEPAAVAAVVRVGDDARGDRQRDLLRVLSAEVEPDRRADALRAPRPRAHARGARRGDGRRGGASSSCRRTGRASGAASASTSPAYGRVVVGQDDGVALVRARRPSSDADHRLVAGRDAFASRLDDHHAVAQRRQRGAGRHARRRSRTREQPRRARDAARRTPRRRPRSWCSTAVVGARPVRARPPPPRSPASSNSAHPSVPSRRDRRAPIVMRMPTRHGGDARDDLHRGHIDPVPSAPTIPRTRACRGVGWATPVAPSEQLHRVRQHREDRLERLAHALRLPRQVDDQRVADVPAVAARQRRHRRLREPRGAHQLGEPRRLPLDHRLGRLGRDVARAEPGAAGRDDERVGRRRGARNAASISARSSGTTIPARRRRTRRRARNSSAASPDPSARVPSETPSETVRTAAVGRAIGSSSHPAAGPASGGGLQRLDDPRRYRGRRREALVPLERPRGPERRRPGCRADR